MRNFVIVFGLIALLGFALQGIQGSKFGRSLLQLNVTNGTTPPTTPPASSLSAGIFMATNSPAELMDVFETVVRANLFANVAAFNATRRTPTFNDLARFDGIFVVGADCFADPTAFGNALARYVNIGGGVLLAGSSFAFPSNASSGNSSNTNVTALPAGSTVPICSTMQGTFAGFVNGSTQRNASAAYTIAVSNGTVLRTNNASLVHDRLSHPIFEDVQNVNLGDGWHLAIQGQNCQAASGNSSCAPCSDDNAVIAEWSDGTRLIMEGLPGEDLAATGRVLVLNMNPVSSNARVGGWAANSDTGTMIANALLYATEYQAHCLRGGALLLTKGALSPAADVQQKVRQQHAVNCSSIYDITAGTPTTALLNRYGAVMLASDQIFDTAALATALNQYRQIGGGIVVAGVNSSLSLFKSTNLTFLPFQPLSGNASTTPVVPLGTSASLAPTQSNSPLLTNVTSLQLASQRVYVRTALASNTSVIANATFGSGNTTLPLIVYTPAQAQPQSNSSVVIINGDVALGGVVGLLFDAESSDAPLFHPQPPQCANTTAQYWAAVTSGGTIMGNAIRTVYNVPASPIPDPLPPIFIPSVEPQLPEVPLQPDAMHVGGAPVNE